MAFAIKVKAPKGELDVQQWMEKHKMMQELTKESEEAIREMAPKERQEAVIKTNLMKRAVDVYKQAIDLCVAGNRKKAEGIIRQEADVIKLVKQGKYGEAFTKQDRLNKELKKLPTAGA